MENAYNIQNPSGPTNRNCLYLSPSIDGDTFSTALSKVRMKKKHIYVITRLWISNIFSCWNVKKSSFGFSHFPLTHMFGENLSRLFLTKTKFLLSFIVFHLIFFNNFDLPIIIFSVILRGCQVLSKFHAFMHTNIFEMIHVENITHVRSCIQKNDKG